MARVTKNNLMIAMEQRFCTKFVALTVCACFLAMCCCNCQFPYQIDPSGNCLFVKNEKATLPEFNSPFTSSQGLRPNEQMPQSLATVPSTPASAYQSSTPGVAASPGTASGIVPSASGTGVVGGSTMLVPGSGPIVLVTPDEQIALIGSEVLLFANYKGDDDYLRIGERIEWSLGGVGHIQTTNKTQCGNVLALDFNKDKKVSDRFAVTSTLHYEGTIDRGSSDEQQGKVPHLAGQSWISIQSAEEGTSTVTAFAPTIKDWNRRTSSATVHWIDAEWIYPRTDITKYDEPKIFITEVKKRSSGSPCPNWVVRYEVIGGGPNVGLGPNQAKVVEVPTGVDGKATIELYLLEGNSGVSTVKATIIRPAGVDRGTKRLELHSANLVNHWQQEAPLKVRTIAPPSMNWGERADWSINVGNSSSVAKAGSISLPLPTHIHFLSSVPPATSITEQPGGGKRVTWDMDFPAMQTTQIRFVLQGETNDPALRLQQLDLELTAELTMYTSRDAGMGRAGSSSSPDNGTMGLDYGNNTGNSSPGTYAPPNSSNLLGQSDGGPLPDRGTNDPGFSNPDSVLGSTTTPPAPALQGNSEPGTFANQLTCDFQTPGAVTFGKANVITFLVTNNASTPFFQGFVQVQLPDGLVFCNESAVPDRDESNNNVILQDFFFIDRNTGQEISVQPGQTYPISFHVTPTKTGNMTISALVASQQRQGIAGTEKRRTIHVAQ